jgi:hypothetical protein
MSKEPKEFLLKAFTMFVGMGMKSKPLEHSQDQEKKLSPK